MVIGADDVRGRRLATDPGARASQAARGRARQRGQSMVEMALILPVFLMFIFGIIEIGRAWAAKQALTNAAREGARVMVLPYGTGFSYPSADAVRTAAIQAAKEYLAFGGFDPEASTVDIKPITEVDGEIQEKLSGELARGEKVGIRITYQFDTALPALLLSGSSPINMGVSSVMEHE
jgi:hypothetical protein